jgi:hypothetical protein
MIKAELLESVVEDSGVTSTDAPAGPDWLSHRRLGHGSVGTASFALKADTQTPRGT